jgi:hypothetical protein
LLKDILANTLTRSDIHVVEPFGPDPLSLVERALFPKLDYVIDIPITLTRTETVKANHIVSVNVHPEAVLGVGVERAMAPVPVFAGRREVAVQTGFDVIQDRVEVGCGFDVGVGGHTGDFIGGGGGGAISD